MLTTAHGTRCSAMPSLSFVIALPRPFATTLSHYSTFRFQQRTDHLDPPLPGYKRHAHSRYHRQPSFFPFPHHLCFLSLPPSRPRCLPTTNSMPLHSLYLYNPRPQVTCTLVDRRTQLVLRVTFYYPSDSPFRSMMPRLPSSPRIWRQHGCLSL
ncbi:hypothetical protein IW262DRAFT_300429 [Armillaria fumosa]|nr:hypothetical protein IW262DRAFT_300429 [Armillaria fumosa]